MVAGAALAADPFVDARFFEKRLCHGVEQNVIDAQAGVGLPVLSEVIPESVNLFVGELRADGIGPALREEALVAVAGFGLEQCVFAPRTRVVDIEVGGTTL